MDDIEPSTSTTKRVSARSRYSQPPSVAFDYGNNDMARMKNSSTPSTTRSSKGGINGGRTYEDDDDDDEMEGLSSRSAIRTAAKLNAANDRGMGGGPVDLTRQRSSTNSVNSSKDRPWRTSSTSSTIDSSSYTTANEYIGRTHSSDSAENSTSVSTPTKNRWAQYETDPNYLAEESRRATSNAVVNMVDKLANNQEMNVNDIMNDLEETQEGMEMKGIIMGGNVGSGYGHTDEMERLEMNGNSLPPSMDRRGSSSRSTTDYVKSRLSSLLAKKDQDEYTVDYSSPSSTTSDHDKVRNEALKMLQIADNCLQDSPIGSTPNSPRGSSQSNGATGLFRTAGGGLAMRELDSREVSKLSIHRSSKGSPSSISGLDKFQTSTSSEKKKKSRFDGTFTIGSHDEDDVNKQRSSNSNGHPVSPNDDTPSLWSSRYSVERQLMAITGGLDSEHILAKMDMLHSSRQKTKSARGLYRASGYAMDGSHEEYNDYNNGSSTGVGLGGIWLWLKGTLWSDELELNYDGTTQSLVRREKAMQRRRRLRYGLIFVMALSVVVGVLVHVGNPKAKSSSGDVNFYVLADEPYDFSNVELLTRELETLPKDAEFVVHLGNANGDIQSRCKEYGFERAAAVLKESPVPVLVIPGDLDWAACGSQSDAEDALYWWDINLGKLEKSWKDENPLNVEYSEDVVGNFSFMHKGVLFISVNMVDVETEPAEVTLRLEQNVLWTKDKLTKFGDDEYHAVVILGHAPPSDKQGEYFWPLVETLADLEKPVLYLHANSNGSFEQYTPFNEAENLQAVQLEKRGREGPMKVVVKQNGKKGGKSSFMDWFSFERRDLAVERIEK